MINGNSYVCAYCYVLAYCGLLLSIVIGLGVTDEFQAL